MVTPNLETAMELLGIPSEYHSDTVADFAQQWGGTDQAACELALHDGGKEDDFMRAFALLALAGSGAPEIPAKLLQYRSDPSPLVRVVDLVSLGYLGEVKSLPELQQMLVTPPVLDRGASDEEGIIHNLCLGLIWGCIPEILGEFGNQSSLSALRQAMLTVLPLGEVRDRSTQLATVQTLLYNAGRLQGWSLLSDSDKDISSPQQLALLMVLGSLHERMVIERERHISGAPIPIPVHLYPNRRVGDVIIQLLMQQFHFSEEQAHAATDSRTGDAYVVADRLLNSVELHKRLFRPLQGHPQHTSS